MSRRRDDVTNSSVDRAAVERLQLKLMTAAEAALDQALADGAIPSSLLSSVQSIIRDAGVRPDLSDGPDGSEGSSDGGLSPSWLSDLEEKLGL